MTRIKLINSLHRSCRSQEYRMPGYCISQALPHHTTGPAQSLLPSCVPFLIQGGHNHLVLQSLLILWFLYLPEQNYRILKPPNINKKTDCFQVTPGSCAKQVSMPRTSEKMQNRACAVWWRNKEQSEFPGDNGRYNWSTTISVVQLTAISRHWTQYYVKGHE